MNDIDILNNLKPAALTAAQSKVLADFVDPGILVEKLSSRGITPDWILDQLIVIAECSDKESTRLSAIKEIRKILEEIAGVEVRGTLQSGEEE